MQIDLSKKELAAIFEGLDKWAHNPPPPEGFIDSFVADFQMIKSGTMSGADFMTMKERQCKKLRESMINERQNEVVLLKAKFLQAANRHEEHVHDEVEK